MDLALIGSRVRSARKQKNLSQDDLAHLAGVHRNTVLNLETATGESPRLDKIAAIAAALGIELSDLVAPDAPTSAQPAGV